MELAINVPKPQPDTARSHSKDGWLSFPIDLAAHLRAGDHKRKRRRAAGATQNLTANDHAYLETNGSASHRSKAPTIPSYSIPSILRIVNRALRDPNRPADRLANVHIYCIVENLELNKYSPYKLCIVSSKTTAGSQANALQTPHRLTKISFQVFPSETSAFNLLRAPPSSPLRVCKTLINNS